MIIAGLLVLIVVAGLISRLFSSSGKPNGTLYDVGGFSLNLDCKGQPNGLPTLVIESGAGTPSQAYHWLHAELQNDMRVCRYDRAGLGFSELGDTGKDAETVAKQLRTLLQAADIQPPYLLAGHSLGGPYIRVYTDMYPDEVTGLIFLDSSHPEQMERLERSQDSGLPWFMSLLPIAGDLGVINLVIMATGSIDEDGIPPEQQEISASFYSSGKFARGALLEMDVLEEILDRAGETVDFGDRPILVFSAGSQPEEQMRAAGFDPEQMKTAWHEMQVELSQLSSDGQQFTMPEGAHMSILTSKDQAEFIISEIRKLLAISNPLG